MYKISCDGFILFDPRDDDLIVGNPKVNLEVNTIGEGSFTIYKNHPYYDKLKKLKSVFEVSDEIGVIFRGRMTDDSCDFYNSKSVDLEGVMGYFNDSTIRPFAFPEDFANDAGYAAAAASGNVVEFFLNWIIQQHNSQVEAFQQFKLGTVTVSDPNNYITRSDSEYKSTWEIIESKLFKSALGGNLCIRYETDGNYIDYLEEFELTNTQEIVFGENLLDLKSEADASSTYSAIIPIGATIETEETKSFLTIESIADGDITSDIVKSGDLLYSKSAVAAYGWICAPVKVTTWEDVTEAQNLLTKGVAFLAGEAVLLSETIEITAVDLHFTDEQIQTFRIYRNVNVKSAPHNHTGTYPLPKLSLDLINPQNTKITVGSTRRTLTDINSKKESDTATKIESTKNELKDYVASVETSLTQKIEGIDGIYFYIKYSAYADGHVMTDSPNSSTQYMGTCSTNIPEAPADYKAYVWCKIRGDNGKDGETGTPGADGVSNYFHVKYSNDGQTFTANGGETLGDWMGTCITETEADPTEFNAYTWKKIKGNDGSNGIDGIDGVDGTDGISTYFFVKFSANANGNPMTETPQADTKYMGVCSTTAATAPASYTAYKWTQCQGNDGTNGIPGAAGKDGKTSYLHIKYSDDGQTFTANSGEDLGAYIGTLVDFTEADSTNFADYTWKKFTEDVDGELESIRQTITEQSTSLTNTAQEIVLSALKEYVEKTGYEEFKSQTETSLSILADQITAKVTALTEQIADVNGDLQSKFNTITKYFTFDIDGLTIGQVDNPNKVVIDNDEISILVNGVAVQSFDSNGNALTPKLKVTESLKLFGFKIDKDSAGNVNCNYVGG